MKNLGVQMIITSFRVCGVSLPPCHLSSQLEEVNFAVVNLMDQVRNYLA